MHPWHAGNRLPSELARVVFTCWLEEILALYRPPQTKREMRASLGLANYYRRFIPDLTTKAVPLKDML